MVRAVHRLALVLFGLVAGAALLVTTEFGLRLTGAVDAWPRRDPFAGFSEIVPLFSPAVRADGTRIYQMTGARMVPQREGAVTDPQREFLAEKPPGTFRIFAIGGSSTAGTPYGSGYAYPIWLQRRLSAELPDVRFEVVNAALPGYATRRESMVVRELARYQPDLLVVYTGHNELNEARFYKHLLTMDPRLFSWWEWLADTRLHRAFSHLFGPSLATPQRRVEADPKFAFMEMFALGQQRKKGLLATQREVAFRALHFQFNVEEMVRTMRAAGARTVLVSLSQNFADWPPPTSAHKPGLTPDQKAACRKATKIGDRHLIAGEWQAALDAYHVALAIDEVNATQQFNAAQCARHLGLWDEARMRYRLASDLDPLPVGAPTAYNDILRSVASREGALFSDADAAIEQAAEHGLVGSEWFCDALHPSIGGHQVIARTVAATLREAGIPEPTARWHPGAWVDPSPDSVYAADPHLHTKEKMLLISMMMLTREHQRARAALIEVLAADPGYAEAQKLLAEVDDQIAKGH